MAHPTIERAVYNTKRWKRFRECYYKERNGLCELCGEPGRVVHHLQELTLDNYRDPDIVYAMDNVQLLCWSCHEKTKTASGVPIRSDIMFDDEGNAVASGKRIANSAGRIPPVSHSLPP